MRLSDIGAINDMPRGWVRGSKLNHKIYNMWHNMLIRCYDKEYHKLKPTYKECTCHKDFLTLSNFVKWIEQEPRYNDFVTSIGNYKWAIDKDILVKGNKEYTYGKIALVTMSENSKESSSRLDRSNYNYSAMGRKSADLHSRAIIGVSVKNPLDMRFYKAVSHASKDGFTPSNIVVCCNKGRQKTHKGYKWYYINNEVIK